MTDIPKYQAETDLTLGNMRQQIDHIVEAVDKIEASMSMLGVHDRQIGELVIHNANLQQLVNTSFRRIDEGRETAANLADQVKTVQAQIAEARGAASMGMRVLAAIQVIGLGVAAFVFTGITSNRENIALLNQRMTSAERLADRVFEPLLKRLLPAP